MITCLHSLPSSSFRSRIATACVSALLITNANSLVAGAPPAVLPKSVFNHTGSNQSFTVPPGVSLVFVKAWGAGGGAGKILQDDYNTSWGGGTGAFVSGYLPVTAGETLQVIVGGGGTADGAGGFGGGGKGGTPRSNDDSLYAPGAGGGGRSAIQRLLGTDLVVAGGGGGNGGGHYDSSFSTSGTLGCNAGLSVGSGPVYYIDGGGGSQTEGGAGGKGDIEGETGSLGLGGEGATASWRGAGGGGGGGGFYGGGGGGTDFLSSGGGGGGSSFTSAFSIAGKLWAGSDYVKIPRDGDYQYPVATAGWGGGNGGAGKVVIYPINSATPDIGVYDGATVSDPEIISDQDSSIDFGVTSKGSPVTRPLTIRNVNASPGSVLTIQSLTFQDGAFDLSSPPALPVTLSAGQSLTLQVRFRALGNSLYINQLTILTDDPDETAFYIPLRGTAAAPEIAVEQPAGTNLVDGSSGVDFGSTPSGTPVTRTFTLKNTGAGPLTGLSAAVTGTTSKDFLIDSFPASVGPGSSVTFTLTFAPGSAGTKQATLSIISNDADENPFDVALTGNGVAGEPGVISIDGSSFKVFEEAGVAEIPLARTGGTYGAVSVNVTTANGTAKAPGDFASLTNFAATFADGESAKTVEIPIKADALATEYNETFTVSLSSPVGAELGNNVSAAIMILEPDDVAPMVSITTPIQNSKTTNTEVSITGYARDNKGVAKVEYSFNDSPFQEAELTIPNTGTTTGTFGNFKATVFAVPGLNTIVARSYDYRGNVSTAMTRTFAYSVMRPLSIAVTPANAGTVTVSPALSGGQAQLGLTYTLTAIPRAGSLWQGWTAPGVTGDVADATKLTIVMSEDLTVTANFEDDALTPGVYTGLAQAKAPTVPAQSNFGLFSGTLAVTSSFSGRVNFGGTTVGFVTAFDKTRRTAVGNNGTTKVAATLAYDLKLDTASSVITGTVTQLSTGEVSSVAAYLNPWSSTNKLPDRLLQDGNNARNGVYNVVFPPSGSQSGLTTSQYPQGYGFATINVTPLGSASLSGTLADGTTVTASAPLTSGFTWPLAVIIKSTATVTGMSLGGTIQFDTDQPDSDATGTDLIWFRPAKASGTSYCEGWPQGIAISMTGAKFSVPVGSSVLPGLGAANPDGNAVLEFSDGLLTEPVIKDLNISAANAITKVATPDNSFALSITAARGLLGGSFLHSGHATVRPVIHGIVLQKGANAGGYGFFISPAPSGTTDAESGAVMLSSKAAE